MNMMAAGKFRLDQLLQANKHPPGLNPTHREVVSHVPDGEAGTEARNNLWCTQACRLSRLRHPGWSLHCLLCGSLTDLVHRIVVSLDERISYYVETPSSI